MAKVKDGEYKGVPARQDGRHPEHADGQRGHGRRPRLSITKALYANKAKLTAIVPSAKGLDPEKGRELIEPVKMHPGAGASTWRRLSFR